VRFTRNGVPSSRNPTIRVVTVAVPAAKTWDVLTDVERVAPEQAVADLRPAKLLGFGSHEQPDALRAARRAGFDRVVARSAIADRLAALVDDLMI